MRISNNRSDTWCYFKAKEKKGTYKAGRSAVQLDRYCSESDCDFPVFIISVICGVFEPDLSGQAFLYSEYILIAHAEDIFY